MAFGIIVIIVIILVIFYNSVPVSDTSDPTKHYQPTIGIKRYKQGCYIAHRNQNEFEVLIFDDLGVCKKFSIEKDDTGRKTILSLAQKGFNDPKNEGFYTYDPSKDEYVADFNKLNQGYKELLYCKLGTDGKVYVRFLTRRGKHETAYHQKEYTFDASFKHKYLI